MGVSPNWGALRDLQGIQGFYGDYGDLNRDDAGIMSRNSHQSIRDRGIDGEI